MISPVLSDEQSINMKTVMMNPAIKPSIRFLCVSLFQWYKNPSNNTPAITDIKTDWHVKNASCSQYRIKRYIR